MRILEGNERGRKQQRIEDMIDTNDSSAKKKFEKGWGGWDRSIESKMKKGGFPIFFVCYQECYGLYNVISSLILVKGLNGEPGTSGGNAGSGGCAGLGGFPGEKAIKGLKNRKCHGSVNITGSVIANWLIVQGV